MISELKPQIEYEEFAKTDIRAGTIIKCEKVEGSEKLLKLDIDFGSLGKKQILTGLAKFYSPEDFEGKQTLFVLNLKPRRMMGLESQGMILGVGLDPDKKPAILFLSEPVENGEGVC